MGTVRIDVWSDLACPWCYVGKRRLEAALAALERDADAPEVRVRWRAFELDPGAPAVTQRVPYAERLARKYGVGTEEGEEMIRRMTETAAADGLEFRFERIRPGNTFDAHRLVRLAAAQGREDAAEERLFRAYLTEGEPLGDRDVLARLGGEIGLDPDEVRETLAGDRFAAEVRGDETVAFERGISAVPCFVIDDRQRISGAQPPEILAATIRRRSAPARGV